MIDFVAIIGILFAMFIPGIFVTFIFFREVKFLERIVLSVAFSIMLSIAIGISLGYNQNIKNLTGGINGSNVWLMEMVITGAFAVIAVAVNWKSLRPSKIFSLMQKFKIPRVKLSKVKETVKYRRL